MKTAFRLASVLFITDVIFCRAFPAAYPDVFDSLPLVWCSAVLKLVTLYGAALLFTVRASEETRQTHLLLYVAALCSLAPSYVSLRIALFSEHCNILLSLFSWKVLFLTYVVYGLALSLWKLILYGLQPSPEEDTEDAPFKDGEMENIPALKRLLSYSLPDFVPLSGAFVFLTLAVIGEMFLPYCTGEVIDILSSKYDPKSFINAITFMALTSIGSSLAAGCRGGLFMSAIARLNKRIRNLLFNSLVYQDIGFFESTHTGEITSCLSNDTSLMSRSIAANVNILLRSLVMTIGIYWFMFRLSWQLTLLSAIESPITLLVEKAYNKYYQKLVKDVQVSIAKSNEAAGEAISCIRTVRSFATEDKESRRYGSKLMETHILKTKRDTIRAGYLLFRRLFQLIMRILIIYFGQNQVFSGAMTTGNLVAFILYQMDVGSYIETLVEIHVDLLQSVSAAEKVFEYLDRKPEVANNGNLEPTYLKGHVQFKNVTFGYPSKPDVEVLKNVSFELNPGSVTAIVGPSGGGKTTCVSLLQRFYQPKSGEVCLDGTPLDQYSHKYLHTKIALVGQEPVLFARSIQDNISYGIQNCSLNQVISAARMSNAHMFIENMDKSYNSDAGEKGGLLSGGQRQRIAIARALIRDPQILILDEATSSLDPDSEYLILEELSKNQGQTILIIAHRLKTVEKADKIIVIEGGTVIEEGTHSELMVNEGCYSRLVLRNFEDNEKDE